MNAGSLLLAFARATSMPPQMAIDFGETNPFHCANLRKI